MTTVQLATTNQITRFHALLSQTGLKANKADMLAGFAVSSTKDLTREQIEELNNRLQEILDAKGTGQAPPTLRKKRSIVLDLLSKMGIYKDSNSWTAVNKFLLDPRIAGKLLYEMDEVELDKLARKLRLLKRKQDSKQAELDRQAQNN